MCGCILFSWMYYGNDVNLIRSSVAYFLLVESDNNSILSVVGSIRTVNHKRGTQPATHKQTRYTKYNPRERWNWVTVWHQQNKTVFMGSFLKPRRMDFLGR